VVLDHGDASRYSTPPRTRRRGVRFAVIGGVVVVVGLVVATGVYQRRYGVMPFQHDPPTSLHWCGATYKSDWAGARREGHASEIVAAWPPQTGVIATTRAPVVLQLAFRYGAPLGDEYAVYRQPGGRTAGVGGRTCPMSVYLKTGRGHYIEYDIPA
jgi:hypothetical protein